MPKAIIVYESKYGNTRLVAETIAQGMKEVPGVEAVVKEVKKVDRKELPGFDVILIGSPTHFGGAVGGAKRFINGLDKLQGKMVAIFDTYMSTDFEKGVKQLERQIAEKAPGLKLAAPGLSIRVEGMKGPIAEGELAKAKEFGAKIAKMVQ